MKTMSAIRLQAAVLLYLGLSFLAAGSPYRIGIAMLAQETNSFSPVPTTLRDFEALGLHYGRDVMEVNAGRKTTLGGFLDAVERFGGGEIEVVPVMQASAMSGGPIENAVYRRFRREIVEGMTAAEPLDGIYLALHGAMGVAGMRDPEGDLLAALREELGGDVAIGVSFDLHANVTEARAELATFIVGYKTNPHRDQYETGFRSGEILVKTVRGQVDPTMHVQKMRLLKGGGMEIDFLAPMRKVFRRMRRMERDPAVLNVSNFMVHVWLDDPELGWTTIAVTDGDPELARKTAEKLADLDWSVRDVEHPEGLSPEEAIRTARRVNAGSERGTAMVCDASDAVGAGAPGENTWILKALLEEGTDLVSYVPLRDEEAAQAACAAEIGEELSLTVGGKLDRVYNRPLAFSGRLIDKRDTQYGRTAILKNAGIHLILTELPVSASHPSFFTDLGLNLWEADFVVVKNLFPFRISYWIYNRRTLNVVTPGTTNVDVFQLRYDDIPRPIYPLDEIDSWR